MIYTRDRGTLPDGRYAIDHPERLDGEGNQLRCSHELAAALPGLVLRTAADGGSYQVETSRELTGPELATLDAVIALHKANG